MHSRETHLSQPCSATTSLDTFVLFHRAFKRNIKVVLAHQKGCTEVLGVFSGHSGEQDDTGGIIWGFLTQMLHHTWPQTPKAAGRCSG